MANPWIVDGSEWEVTERTEQSPDWRQVLTDGPTVDDRRRVFDELMERLADRMQREDEQDDEHIPEEDEIEDEEDDDFDAFRQLEDFEDPQAEPRELTPEEIFLRDKGEHCPVCGSEYFNADGIDPQNTTKYIITIKNVCADCESTWKAKFKLYNVTDVEDNTGMDDDALKRLGL